MCVTGVVEAWEVRQVVKDKDEATTSASEARKLLVWVLMILGVSVIANAIIVVRRARGRGNPVKCGGGRGGLGGFRHCEQLPACVFELQASVRVAARTRVSHCSNC